MRIKIIYSILTLTLLSTTAMTQSLSVDIGDPAPTLHPEAWLQGPPVDEFRRGQVYVIYFWSRGISPDLPWMPRLTEKMRENIQFLSVNSCKATDGNPELALELLKSNINKGDSLSSQVWCNLLARIAVKTKLDSTKQEAVKISASCVAYSSYWERVIVLGFHAKVLAAAGRIDDARTALEEALARAPKFHPTKYRPQISNFLYDVQQAIARE